MCWIHCAGLIASVEPIRSCPKYGAQSSRWSNVWCEACRRTNRVKSRTEVNELAGRVRNRDLIYMVSSVREVNMCHLLKGIWAKSSKTNGKICPRHLWTQRIKWVENSFISRLRYQVSPDDLLLRRVKESAESSLDAWILSREPCPCLDLKTAQEA